MQNIETMRISEIAEYLVTKFSQSLLATNDVVEVGCRDVDYEDYLVSEVIEFFNRYIGMCGCGCPEYTYEMLRKLLRIRLDRSNEELDCGKVSQRYLDDIGLDENQNKDHDGIVHFILYILDDKDIVEHGSSIGGCWLTELGKIYLRVLDIWHDWYNSSN